MTGASSNARPVETHQQRRPQLAHRKAAIGATESVTQDAYLQTLLKTELSNNMKQHTIGYE